MDTHAFLASSIPLVWCVKPTMADPHVEIGIIRDALDAVSYTHLDVYKRQESGDPADWSEEALAKLPTEIPRIGAVVGYWVRYGRGCAIRFNLDGEPLDVSEGIPAPW